jgi:hydrogenase maturation protease
MTCKIGLLGLGNLMRTDDAVGMLTLQTLAETACCLLTCGSSKAGHWASISSTASAVFRTSWFSMRWTPEQRRVNSEAIRRQEVDDLPVSKSVHLLGFSDLMGALRLMDAAPAEVVLLGVQPASTDWGTLLSPEVDLALQTLMQSALEQLAQWTVGTSALAAPATESRDLEIVT